MNFLKFSFKGFFKTVAIIILPILIVFVVAQAGSLTPLAAPAATSYTLSDIYLGLPRTLPPPPATTVFLPPRLRHQPSKLSPIFIIPFRLFTPAIFWRLPLISVLPAQSPSSRATPRLQSPPLPPTNSFSLPPRAITMGQQPLFPLLHPISIPPIFYPANIYSA